MHPSKTAAVNVPALFASRFKTLAEKGLAEAVKKWFLAVGKADFKHDKRHNVILSRGAGKAVLDKLSPEELKKMVIGLTKTPRRYCVQEDDTKWSASAMLLELLGSKKLKKVQGLAMGANVAMTLELMENRKGDRKPKPKESPQPRKKPRKRSRQEAASEEDQKAAELGELVAGMSQPDAAPELPDRRKKKGRSRHALADGDEMFDRKSMLAATDPVTPAQVEQLWKSFARRTAPAAGGDVPLVKDIKQISRLLEYMLGIGGADRQAKSFWGPMRTTMYPSVYPGEDRPDDPETSLFHDMSRNYGIIGHYNKKKESKSHLLPDISTKSVANLTPGQWGTFFRTLRQGRTFKKFPHYWSDLKKNRVNLDMTPEE